MAQNGSKTVVYAALAGNLAIAATKLGASFYTGSSAMFTEAIHSFVDTGDQGLLLYGMRRAARPPSETHPFGHGLELYFWSFVVALLIFTLGGVFSIYEGVEKIQRPEPIASAWVNFVVIGASMLFEGYSFSVAWREMRAQHKDAAVWTALRRSKDPSTFTVILEDGAALAGLLIALIGVSVSLGFSMPLADGIASVAIGALLITVALVLARETRSLLTGESASSAVLRQVRELIEADARVVRIADMRSLQLGTGSALLAAVLELRQDLSASEWQEAMTDLRKLIRSRLPVIGYLYLSLHEQTADLQASRIGQTSEAPEQAEGQ